MPPLARRCVPLAARARASSIRPRLSNTLIKARRIGTIVSLMAAPPEMRIVNPYLTKDPSPGRRPSSLACREARSEGGLSSGFSYLGASAGGFSSAGGAAFSLSAGFAFPAPSASAGAAAPAEVLA